MIRKDESLRMKALLLVKVACRMSSPCRVREREVEGRGAGEGA